MLVKLVRGWYFMGDAYESEVENKLASLGKRPFLWSACLTINPEYKAILEKGGEKGEAIAAATIEDVPYTYWTSFLHWENGQKPVVSQ